jgi:phage FluMu gp28-like protein
MTEPAVQSEPLDLSQGEKKDLVGLVEEAQSKRMTRRLKPSDVPKILLPYQIRQHQNSSALRLTDKCRRIGWSWGCIAAEGALEAARERGMSQFYMGYNLGMAAENIGDALTFARAYGLAAGALTDIEVFRDRETMQVWENGVLGEKRQDITRFKLTFASGFVYEALSSAPWNWRGRQGHAWIDEAAFHNDLAEVIKGAMAFLMWGGRVDVISTENGEDNPFHEMVKDWQAGKLPKWTFTKIDFDQALREGFYKRVCLVLGKEWSPAAEVAYRAEIFEGYPSLEDANEELLCIPKRGTGVYFSRMLLENCMEDGIPTLRWEKPAEWVTCPTRMEECEAWIRDVLRPALDAMTSHRSTYGQDFARDGDLSAIKLSQERKPHIWTEAFSIELRGIPFDVQARIRDEVLDGVPALHHAAFDASGNGASHAEGALQKLGAARVSCIKLSAAFYAEWFPKYRQSFEDRSTIIARDENTILDHRHVISTRSGPTMDDKRSKGTDGKPRHGDRAIAGLMEYYARCQDGGPLEFESAGGQRESLGAYGVGLDHFVGTNKFEEETVGGYQDFEGWEL